MAKRAFCIILFITFLVIIALQVLALNEHYDFLFAAVDRSINELQNGKQTAVKPVIKNTTSKQSLRVQNKIESLRKEITKPYTANIKVTGKTLTTQPQNAREQNKQKVTNVTISTPFKKNVTTPLLTKPQNTTTTATSTTLKIKTTIKHSPTTQKTTSTLKTVTSTPVVTTKILSSLSTPHSKKRKITTAVKRLQINTTVMPKNNSMTTKRPITATNGSQSEKIILAYIPFWYNDLVQNMKFDTCKQKNCRMTKDTKLHNISSGIFMCERYLPIPVPKKLKDQIWIFHTDESPFHTNYRWLKPEYNQIFDYTMTYQNRSRFPLPYGRIIDSNEKNISVDNIFESKVKDVLWFETNCNTPSQRRRYVNEMQKFIKVDIYGACGPLKCGKSVIIHQDQCHIDLTKKYRFYLAFENSICQDYVTEKVFHIFQHKLPIIPVVRSAPNVKQLLPNGTFIDAKDFKNPKALAEFLIQLGKDKEKYNGYLRRIRRYDVISQPEFFRRGMCDLCEMINNKPIQRPAPWNIDTWRRVKQCVQPGEIKDFLN